MRKSGREGFHCAAKIIFDFEDVGVVDFGLLVFLPDADQLFQDYIFCVVEGFCLLANRVVFGVEFGNRAWRFAAHAALAGTRRSSRRRLGVGDLRGEMGETDIVELNCAPGPRAHLSALSLRAFKAERVVMILQFILNFSCETTKIVCDGAQTIRPIADARFTAGVWAVNFFAERNT